MQLSDLTHDALEPLGKYCSPQDLCALSGSSRYFHTLTNDPLFLQCFLQNRISEMEINKVRPLNRGALICLAKGKRAKEVGLLWKERTIRFKDYYVTLPFKTFLVSGFAVILFFGFVSNYILKEVTGFNPSYKQMKDLSNENQLKVMLLQASTLIMALFLSSVLIYVVTRTMRAPIERPVQWAAASVAKKILLIKK